MSKKTLVFLFVALSVLALSTATFAQGRKISLLVGINEYDGENISKLKSCVNDAVNMRTKLARNYGFKTSDMTLLDDAKATRQNILQWLEYYEKQSSKGDLFVFYYSGHGSVFPDANSLVADETEQFGMPGHFPSGYYDSALVPVDAQSSTSRKAWNNLILDDELNAIFSRFTAKGVKVIFISDSCHSGTLAKGLNLKEQKEFKFVSPKAVGFDPENWKQSASRRGRKSNENFNKLFLVIGSSQDNQFSRAGGAQDMSLFTKVLIAKLGEFSSGNQAFTYRSVIDVVKPEVDRRSGGSQTPRFDDRFFETSYLNKPIFSLPVAAAANNRMRIVVKVTDDSGIPVSDASFGVFPAGAKIGKGEIQKSQVLMLGKTDRKGLFDSGAQNLMLGRYQIKVVKTGYQSFIRDMVVVQAKNNTLVLVFKLVRERN